MKLYLPKTLLTAVMACYALQAQGTDTLSLNERFVEGQNTVTSYDTNLTLDGNIDATWNEKYEYYQGKSLSWSGNGGSNYSLTGNGTLTGFSFIVGSQGSYEIGEGVTFVGSQIFAQASENGDATLIFKGSLGEGLVGNTFAPEYGGTIKIATTLSTDNTVDLHFNGGTIVMDAYTVSGKHSLTIDTYGLQDGGGENSFQGNLILGANGVLTFYANEEFYYDDEIEQRVTTYIYDTLHASKLTVTGNTKVLFTSYTEDPLEAPAVGTILITCDDFDPATSGVKLAELQMWTSGGYTFDDETYETEYHDDIKVTDLHLGYATALNGGYEIRVVEGAPSTPTPDGPAPEPENIPVTESSISGELSGESGRHVLLSGNNTVDATGVTNLSNAYVKGDGGELVTTATQEMTFSGTDTLGYNIVGDGTNAAAQLTVGAENGSMGDAYINLTGASYASDTINVLSGQLNTASGTTLGTADSLLTVGSDAASGNSATATANNYGTVAGDVQLKKLATMDNRGTIQGDVQLSSGSAFANNGIVNGSVTVKDGARIQGSNSAFNGVVVIETGASHHVGNSPGYQVFSGGLTYQELSNLSYSVDGTTPASANKAGDGTHSFAQVSGGALTIEGNVNTTVKITSGILAAGSKPFTLTLMQVDLANATIDNQQGIDQPFTLVLNDTRKLLEDGAELLWDNTAGTLTFTGTVNAAAAAALLGSDGSTIANTLWSSTSAVRAFARTATSQLSAPVATGDYTVWGSALGDYVSMTGFRSQAHGYAVGADKQFCPHVRAGFAFGQMFGDFTADRGVAEVEQESIMVGLYTEYLREIDKNNSLSVTSYIAYGQTENDADTRVGGSSELPGSASWEDETLVMGTRAEWNIRVTDKTTLTPFIGIEYTHGSQDDFTESFAGGRREYRDGSMQVWSLPMGVTARTEVALTDTQKLLPELTLAYVGDIARKDPHVRSRVYGIDNCHEGTKPGRSAFMMNVGTHWLITEDWSASAFYNLETRSHEVSQEASISVRYTF